ncbi:MAG: Gfo/Idh/MocA family oxidoreductase [Clostridia bacterium]|nr:Gfo/Idh/MocA family oxidoreductase [Clostridia bacterium]NCC43249.1 Gfo/Idh/MocA family oxidoreductase [Clostridia bacterium]
MKAKFVMIGCGWRSQFYLRAVQALPDELEVSAILVRSREKAERVQQETGIFATEDVETAFMEKPDFALLCVPRSVMTEWIIKLMERQIPVLCETPPGKDIAELNFLWEKKQELAGMVQVTEQYFLQPYYKGVQNIIGSGVLGTVSNVSMSAIHGYHAISIFRKFLGLGYENCSISGKKFSFLVTKTRDRAGWHKNGELLAGERDRVDFVFENGKTAFYDFDGEQYFSPIRNRTWNIQGERGEIRDMSVCYLDEKNQPVTEAMHREDDGVYNIDGWSHMYITFRGQRIYENPFQGVRLNDDEIAVADVLMHMKKYVETGEDFYPLREGLQDAYLNFCMEEALEIGEAVKTEPQSWV